MSHQRGATLLVALIMLVLMTLAAVMSFNIARSNSAIIGNQQAVQATTNSAKEALEEALSRTLFADTPNTPFANNTNQKTYDTNGDGVADVTVTMTPAPCVRLVTILPVDPTDTTSQGCVGGALQNMGVEGAAQSGTTCADVVWELTAAATDNVTEARTTAVQGVRVRQDVNTAVNSGKYCPTTQ